MELRAINGRYFPSFFCIHADTEEKPECFLNQNNIDTIIHEYIHFIQDVSTVYGLANTSNTFKDIFYFYNIEEIDIKLPYRFHLEEKTREINRDLFDIYLSHCEYSTIPLSARINILETNASELGIEGFPELKYYEIEFTKGNQSEKYYFGACAIMEGMAQLLEHHLYPNSKPKKTKWTVPYDLPEIVATHIYPIIGKCPAFLVALCDMSLMYYHPGEVFITILKIMKNNGFVPSSLYDIYNFVHNHLQMPGANFRTFWLETVNHTLSDIKNLVNIDNYLVARDWALESISYYYDKRKNDIAFIANLMLLPPSEAKIRLFSTITAKTSPIIYNNQMKIGVIAGNDMSDKEKGNLIYWYNLSKIYDYLFIHDRTDCPFQSFCILSEKCKYKKTPWKRKGCGYCFYQQYSRMVGLYKRNIVL
ncbi:MAG: hypothetical protein MdMp014T_2342 [Treponematales bacterium]